MADDYLATGFRNVDDSDDFETFSRCLTLLDSLEYYREYKKRTYRLLELRDGERILDAGCGLGNDLYRMAELIAPRGEAVGVDASRRFLDAARTDPRFSSLPVRFVQANLRKLPFADETFTRIRIDRVLQHIPLPEEVVAELTRVLSSGGIFLTYDNDWSDFHIHSDGDSSVTKSIEKHWTDSFANPSIGTELPKLFQMCNLGEIRIDPLQSVIEDFPTADAVYNITATLTQLIRNGTIEESVARDWIDTARTGIFRVTLNSYIVTGRK